MKIMVILPSLRRAGEKKSQYAREFEMIYHAHSHYCLNIKKGTEINFLILYVLGINTFTLPPRRLGPGRLVSIAPS